ncbi:choice-of-anchor D domain-containing protein [Actinokineospora alba]|uniref:choice-of-anchor D domain-containing protein n=1 Tax=Actinokineospora alba TaxID=504798 RepID=UPI0010610379|nr:choice-of-anchor D domain-containing protein [Actinokineospora alba]
MTAPAAAQVVSSRTERVSVFDTGTEAVGGSFEPSVSADGRHVVFTTEAALDPLDGEDADLDVYARDRVTGKTIMLSRGQLPGTAGETQPNGASRGPSISADGRHVAFQSTAWNFGTPDQDFVEDVFVVDRDPDGDAVFDERTDDGAVAYRYISVGRRTDFDNFGRLWENIMPSVSADGTTVAWMQHNIGPPSLRSKLRLSAAVPDDELVSGIVVLAVLGKDPDGQLDQPAVDHPYLIVDNGPPGYEDNFRATEPMVSADGRRVVITALLRRNGVPGAGERAIVEVTVPDGLTSRLDLVADGSPVPGSVGEPTVSGNGRMVGFTWEDPQTSQPDVLVVDRDPDGDGRLSGAGNDEPFVLRIASRNVLGEPGGGLSPALSADGRYLAFATFGRSMHGGVDAPDSRGRCVQPRSTSVCDIVVRDLVTDGDRELSGLGRLPAELASPSLRQVCTAVPAPDSTCEADGDSSAPALSADAGTVVYDSAATDLVADDTNDFTDVFVRQFSPAMTSTPSSIDFGTILIGNDSTATAAFDYAGFGPLTVGSVSISGPAAQDFDVFPAETCVGRTFHTTGACVVSVRFRPTSTGVRTATLRLQSPQGVPLGVAALTGGGEPVVLSIDIDQDVVAFGDRLALTSSPPRTVTVRNVGTVALDIGEVALQPEPGVPAMIFPGDYTIATNECRGRSLSVGGSCAITVTHTPQGTGSRPAVLIVPSNASTGARLIRLEGSGSATSLEVNPSVVRDGAVTMVTGKGFPPLQVIAVSTLGGAGEYSVTTDGQGAFALSYIVFPNASLGIRRVEASFAGVRPPIASAVEILVVPGSAAPPDFTRRR